ncbi:hypothetical protein RHMOL_Rhmol06G0148700 [Rhododendron molle]|uniref:Uncharacterized protein n=1 Tax=Rhododendron molle TaxID=49168 RepID=A0ACC0NEG7_RHOML|nr:hypothetical protein RHMOL_Rhmol06G0148700 [Rhododendron molle]
MKENASAVGRGQNPGVTFSFSEITTIEEYYMEDGRGLQTPPAHPRLFSFFLCLLRTQLLFLDGAYLSSRSKAAFGVIARDSGGQALWWRVGRVMGSSAKVIEAWVLRIACSTALDLNLPEVIFESDCKALIDCLNSSSAQCPWEIYAIVEDIKGWAAARNWSFVWCCRNSNTVAHWLASSCLDRNIQFFPGCIPPGLRNLLVRDSPC